MRLAKIENGKVTNVIKADSALNGFIECNVDTAIGDLYDGTTFSKYVEPIPVLTLDEQKLAKIKQLQDKYQQEYDAYLAQYPKREVDSFPVKQAEAIAYTANNTALTPVIDAIVGSNATLKSAYITSIMAKVTALAQQEGQMVTIRDSIKACTTQAELDGIVI